MKIGLLTPSSLGVSAMLVAMCGYAGAQVSPQPTPQQQQTMTAQQGMSQNMQETTPANMQLVSANAQLNHELSTKNAIPGQPVMAKLTSDVKTANGMKLEDGTVLVGRVENVQKSQNDGPSTVSIVFNQARLNNGRMIPVKATLLGAYPVGTGSYFAETGSSGGLMAVQPETIPNDQKVVQKAGTLDGVSMHSAVQSNASGTFMSNDGNVDLKKGTRLQIAIAPMTGTAASS